MQQLTILLDCGHPGTRSLPLCTLARITANSESDGVLEAMYDTPDNDSDDEATTAMRYILYFGTVFFVTAYKKLSYLFSLRHN